MKNTFKYICALAIGLVAVSCNKALDKAEVEAGFAPKVTIPTVTNPVLEELILLEKCAVVSVTYSDYTADTDSLELGFLVSTDPTFATSKAVILETVPEDGTVTTKVPVTPGKVNYIMATASSVSGSNFSTALEVDVPTVPWYYMLAETYTADISTYFGYDYKGHTVGVELSEDTNSVTFKNLDVSLAMYYGVHHQLTGTVNKENRTVSFELVDGFVDIGLSAAGCFIHPMKWSDADEDLTPADSFVISFAEDGSTMTVQSYGLVLGESYDDLYFDQIYTAN